jgi:hypothetical protein
MSSWIKRKTKTWKSGGITYRRTETFNSKTGQTRKSFSSGNKYSRKTFSTNSKNKSQITNTARLDGGLFKRETKSLSPSYKKPKAIKVKFPSYKPKRARTRKGSALAPSAYFSNNGKGSPFGYFLIIAMIFILILGSI